MPTTKADSARLLCLHCRSKFISMKLLLTGEPPLRCPRCGNPWNKKPVRRTKVALEAETIKDPWTDPKSR